MSLNLGQLLERSYRDMHADIVDGLATGGTTTTIVDTGLTSKSFRENHFKDWVAFISRTTDAAAPQYQFGIATAYVKSSGTITIPTVTATVGAGDEYALCNPLVPLYTHIKLCNDALNDLFYAAVDTSLTTVAETVRYTLPIATKGIEPYQVYLRDPSDYTIYEAPNWFIEAAAPGSTETLVFKWQPDTDLTIVLDYASLHPQLTTYSSSVSEKIHPALAVAACVEKALYWKMKPKQRKIDVANWQEAKRHLEEMKAKHKIEMPQKQKKMLPINLYN